MMSINTASYILASIFAIAGLLSVSASAANWNWFFESPNVRLLTSRLSRGASRIFYALIGVAILAMAFAVSPLSNFM